MGRRKRKPASRNKAGAPGRQAKSADKLRRLADRVRELRCRDRELTALLDRFQERDMPAFHAWLRENLADEQAEMARLLEELEFHEILLAEAELAMAEGRYRSIDKAIVAVRAEMEERWRREAADEADEADEPDPDEAGGDPDSADGFPPPPPMPEMPEEVVDFLFESFMADVRGIDIDDLDAADYRKARAEFEASFEHAASGNRVAFERALMRAGADDSETNRAKVKAAYRRLAKRLHPDHHGELGEVEKELWEAASLQYHALDLRGIEETEVLLHIERDEPIQPGMAPTLRRMGETLEERIEDAEAELAEARTHPAWNFAGKRRTKALVTRIRSEMRKAARMTAERLEELRFFIKRLAPKPRKAKKRKAKRKSPGKRKTAAGTATTTATGRKAKTKAQRKAGKESRFEGEPAERPARKRRSSRAKTGPSDDQWEFPF